MLKGHRTVIGILSMVGLFTVSTVLLSGCVNFSAEEKAKKSPPVMEKKVVAQPTQAPAATPADPKKLLSTDCQKCHKDQPSQIDSNGGKHKSEISCRDCHEEHPPLGDNTIPQCSNCHDSSERKHFALENCLFCHSNPHTPLELTIADVPESTVGCKTCHEDKDQEFSTFPSKHAEQTCTLCHPDKHKMINDCLVCHEGHIDLMEYKMVYEDCLRCHKPHSPIDITYADDTPSILCGACHGDVYRSLTSNPSKHKDLNCAYCHQDRHPTVPACTDCHEGIHSPSLLLKFPDCLKCHNDPHDLVI